jgi:hypothetical protein
MSRGLIPLGLQCVMTGARTSRRRLVARYLSLVLTVLSIGAWAGGRWYYVDYHWWRSSFVWAFYITKGGAELSGFTSHNGIADGFGAGRIQDAPTWSWWFEVDWQQPTGRMIFRRVFVPLWPVIVLAGAATLVLWRPESERGRRKRLGLCRSCGYDRRGLAPDAPCPECGTVPPPAS